MGRSIHLETTNREIFNDKYLERVFDYNFLGVNFYLLFAEELNRIPGESSQTDLEKISLFTGVVLEPLIGMNAYPNPTDNIQAVLSCVEDLILALAEIPDLDQKLAKIRGNRLSMRDGLKMLNGEKPVERNPNELVVNPYFSLSLAGNGKKLMQELNDLKVAIKYAKDKGAKEVWFGYS